MFGRVILYSLLLFLFAACTDYEAMIDDEYEDWVAEQANFSEPAEDFSSSSLDEASSSSVASSCSAVMSSSVYVYSSSSMESSSSISSSRETYSSSSEKSSSSVFYPVIDYGELIDSRDGQTYKTVTIGSQVWMAENLNFEVEGSYCYGGLDSNCTKYGRLYTWIAATDGGNYFSVHPLQGICPEGWHLPDSTEWGTLIRSVGDTLTAGGVLKSASGWANEGNGTDLYGFSALPAGYRSVSGKSDNETYIAYFWNSTINSDATWAFSVYIDFTGDRVYKSRDFLNDALSVRCLKGNGVAISSSSSSAASSSSVGASSSSSSARSSSSSKIASSSSSIPAYIQDSRDGQTYKVVKIGNQVWMAKNLNYAATGSSCYENLTSNCNSYGRLYTWTLAKNVCPSGWHLPSKDEFSTLFSAVGGTSTAGKKLKSQYGWDPKIGGADGNGTDDYGFAAYPAGEIASNGKSVYMGEYAFFWNSKEAKDGYAYYVYIQNTNGQVYMSAYADENDKYSVRCIMD